MKVVPMCQADLGDGMICQKVLGHDGAHNPNVRFKGKCGACGGRGEAVEDFIFLGTCKKCDGEGYCYE